jgi:hypothetical protein
VRNLGSLEAKNSNSLTRPPFHQRGSGFEKSSDDGSNESYEGISSIASIVSNQTTHVRKNRLFPRWVTGILCLERTTATHDDELPFSDTSVRKLN